MPFDPPPAASQSGFATAKGTQAGAPLLELAGVSKTYLTGEAALHALAGVDLSIWPGEFVAIMGPSGSGKSTLVHILGCLDTPTAGTYVIAGRDVSELDEVDLAWIRNHKIGFVFQQFHLLGRQSATRNVELPLLYAGVRSGEQRRARTAAGLAAVGMADRAEHRPHEPAVARRARRLVGVRDGRIVSDEQSPR